MIRWCSYCQKLLGEFPPLTDYRVSHGLCSLCRDRLMAGESLAERHRAAIDFYRKLFAAASQSDPSTCAALVCEGRDLFGGAELLIGMLQPALVEIGASWERGAISVAEEHRFSAWCETMLAALPRQPRPKAPADLLILSAPGNMHDLGPRVAEYVLLAHGLNCEAVLPELPPSSIVDLVQHEQPRWVGFSCSLPSMIEPAIRVVQDLRRAGYPGGIMFSGQALRRYPELAVEIPDGLVVCLTLDEARAVLQPSWSGNQVDCRDKSNT